MKPDKNTCLNCSKQVSLRAKYCSDKCTKQYVRNSDKRSDKPNSDTPNSELGQPTRTDDDFRATLTKCDKTFYDRAIKEFTHRDGTPDPYYNFDGERRKAKCNFCQTPYETNLSLNRYCSYLHYNKATDSIVR